VRRLASIDIGTNTVRMLVSERVARRDRPLARLRVITGLGRALRDTGRIGDAEFRASVEVLREFRAEMDRLGVDVYRACGTAALRDAGNRDAFLAAAEDEGIDVEVIDPAEEGRLAWEGIRRGVAGRAGDVAMDIGGGSTEFTAGPGDGESVSLPVGVVTMSSLLPLSDPPRPWERAAVEHFAARRVGDGTRFFGGRRFRRLVGTAGTFTTLAALDRRMSRYDPDRINGATLSAAAVRRLSGRLWDATDAGRLALRGMEKGRERYILPGIALALAAIARFGVDGVTVSDAGLLEGILAGI
jgi:exopolyphosphatase/guanosine-5'-triphosphate,3'-diphosphate pyrophosphatase